MSSSRLHPSQVSPEPALGSEALYVGIDVGKHEHVAGFVSTTLLKQHERFEGCPALKFSNTREGFRQLIDRIRLLVALEQCFVLLEQTGHYHKALEQYLLEMDLSVYVIHVQSRPVGLLKTDKRDALGLANRLFNQLEKLIQVEDKLQLVRRALPPTEAASFLKSLIRHRYELIHESTQRKNKLTSILDELFPEFTQVFKDPNLPSALAIRWHFPTPQSLAGASLEALRECRRGHYPSDAKLILLQQLARQSIGTKDFGRRRGVVLEQTQLIKELQLLQQHLAQLDAEIRQIVTQSREGQILTSIPPIGPVQAGILIATIGNIGNFPHAGALKAYFGWAPTVAQTGISRDHTWLTSRGTRPAKHVMFLIVWQAIKMEGEWARLYERLVPLKCSYDERTRSYHGKGKVIGRVAGQMISLFYGLLKQDAERIAKTPPGSPYPDPILYDPALHQAHRAGQYRSMKQRAYAEVLVQASAEHPS